MKRIIVVFLLLLLIFTAACGKDQPDRLLDGSVRFTDNNYPVVCVTPLTMEMGINMTVAVLGIDRDTAASKLNVCDTTDECYRKLIDGECDIVIAHDYGKSIETKLNTTALTLTSTELDRDAAVFVTNGKTGVDTLSVDQLVSLYNAETTDWSALGGAELSVTLFGKKSGTAVQNAFEKYISSDITVPAVTKTIETATGSFSAEISYDNRNGAIGYELLSLVKSNVGALRPMSINGVAPSKETVLSGEYPLTLSVNAVMRSSEATGSEIRVLYEWLVSEQGRACTGNLY